ncbi:hypothetical protein [Streptomyces sp. NPDC088246]|uniref:hypothetical protein n=1 Tax=Streptomyces sp. NPDC088246 TaxID=3365842 RepID=UPI00382D1022
MIVARAFQFLCQVVGAGEGRRGARPESRAAQWAASPTSAVRPVCQAGMWIWLTESKQQSSAAWTASSSCGTCQPVTPAKASSRIFFYAARSWWS